MAIERDWSRISEYGTERRYYSERHCYLCGARYTDIGHTGSARCQSCGQSWVISGTGGTVAIVDVYR